MTMKGAPYAEDKSVEKIVELVGRSHNGWQEAVENTVAEAVKTVRNIREVAVKRLTAEVENDKIVEYRAVVKITFMVEREI
jgi:dodecin